MSPSATPKQIASNGLVVHSLQNQQGSSLNFGLLLQTLILSKLDSHRSALTGHPARAP